MLARLVESEAELEARARSAGEAAIAYQDRLTALGVQHEARLAASLNSLRAVSGMGPPANPAFRSLASPSTPIVHPRHR